MNALYPLLLSLALTGQALADDLMDNADLAVGSDLGDVLVALLGLGRDAVVGHAEPDRPRP